MPASPPDLVRGLARSDDASKRNEPRGAPDQEARKQDEVGARPRKSRVGTGRGVASRGRGGSNARAEAPCGMDVTLGRFEPRGEALNVRVRALERREGVREHDLVRPEMTKSLS